MSRATDCNYNDRQLVMPRNIFKKKTTLKDLNWTNNPRAPTTSFLFDYFDKSLRAFTTETKRFWKTSLTPHHMTEPHTHIYAEWVPQTLRRKTIPPCPVWSAERIQKTLFDTRFLKISDTIRPINTIFLQLFLRASAVTFAQLCWHWLSS